MTFHNWFKLFRFWAALPKIESADQLVDFIHTRSVYVAQRSLYGYLKTRMGTRYREFFEHDVFAQAIRTSSVKVAVGCISDLTIFAVAKLVETGALPADEAQHLASFCHAQSCARAFLGPDRGQVPEDADSAFHIRAANTQWTTAAQGENAFARSPQDLVRYAPVIDEYKDLDQEIVMNSIRFLWNEVRDELRKALVVEKVSADWSRQAPAEAERIT